MNIQSTFKKGTINKREGVVNIYVAMEDDYDDDIDIATETYLTRLKNLTTHELGHALGYSGHAPNSLCVMYGTSTVLYELSTMEKDYLGEIYNRFS